MLRIIQNNSPSGARHYYSTSDYYIDGQEIPGVWRGNAARTLGLSGAIGKADWEALCDNLDPRNGERLTVRVKGVRRVGYDLTFNPPKSVSLLYGLSGDERLLDAFRTSVAETMCDIEADAQTRVRRNGRNDDRTTGNLAWGEYVHFTSRPVDGVPDPQLHAHCFVFNGTFDAAESRWKAVQFAGIKRDGPYYEALFHARLAQRLAGLGLPIERTRKSWEVAGLPKDVLDRFSRRTDEIEKLAAERGITDPHTKDALGGTTRQRKSKELSMPELRCLWANRLNTDESAVASGLIRSIGGTARVFDPNAAHESVEQAVSHCFERSAVVHERKLLAEALRRSVGMAPADTVLANAASHPLIRRKHEGQSVVTTREVLAEEQRMLDFAREGRATCRPLGSACRPFERDWLDDDQKRAVQHVLTSTDRVILVRGQAGTGKTTMMQEAVAGIAAGGHRVFTFAPSAGASRGVLRSEGFKDADTVARLLSDPKLQEEVRGQVLWIDEAGLLGSRMTARLFNLADRTGARLVLSGDYRQHGSVERGGVLRLIEEHAGLPTASLTQIKRQQHAEYRQAVTELANGDVACALNRLDQLGWIKEIADGDRYRAVAQAYIDSTQAGGDTLLVTPTHAEALKVTADIRSMLRAAGRLEMTGHKTTVLRPLNLTETERADPVSYLPGDTLVLHQNIPGHRKGEHLVAGRDELPLQYADRFTAFRPDGLILAAGDRVRITKNLRVNGGATRLNNGDIHSVRSVSPGGDITLKSGATLHARSGLFLDYGYAVTSHSAQGRSVDRVIVAQSSMSFAASSREQAYVSISRGRYGALIFTDDKKALCEAVNMDDQRISATELISGRSVERTARKSQSVASRSAPMRAQRMRLGESPRERTGYEPERT